MSSEKHPNLQLNKWTPSDYVKMAEFNENFKKIDDKAKEITDAKTDYDGVAHADLPTRLTTDFGKVTSQLADIAKDIQTEAQLILAIGLSVPLTLNIGRIVGITSNLTIPSNVILKFNNGGAFSIASGVTLTINGYIEAGYYQIFQFADSTSKVVTTSPGEWGVSSSPTFIHYDIKVDWFGAKPDAVPPINFTSNYNQIPTGTDSSDGFRRAFKFATLASISGDNGIEKTPRVTVTASGNGGYYVKGHNLMGCQDNTVKFVNIDFNGNMCQIFHEVLTNTDALIGEAHKINQPYYRDFSVDIYNQLSTERMGKFLDLNGEGQSFIEFVKPQFKNIRAGRYYLGRGYDIIFNINGTTMADNGHVEDCNFGSFNTLFYCTNPEAVNWKFHKCGIWVTTINGKMFHFNGAFSGSFTVDSCEMNISSNGERILKTEGNGDSTSKFRIINSRLESLNVVDTTFFDLDFGMVEVEGINAGYGGGGGTAPTTKRTARIGAKAFLRMKDCTFPHAFSVVGIKSGVNTTDYYNALHFENCTFNDGITASGYPKLYILDSINAEISLKTALTNGYSLRKVIVDNPRYVDYEMVLPITYHTGLAYLNKVMFSTLYNGKPQVNSKYARLPHYCVVKSMKLYVGTLDVAVSDTLELLVMNTQNSSVHKTYTFSLDGTVKYGMELVPSGKQLTLNDGNASLYFSFKKSGVTVDKSLLPASYVEIEYRGVNSSFDYGATENMFQEVSVV